MQIQPHLSEVHTGFIRRRCRYPRCGAKFRPAVSNPRDAFCSSRCFAQFYRRHCLVCERPIPRKTERQILCGRQKCKGQFRRHKEQFLPTRYLASVLSPNASGSAHFTGLKIGTKSGRGFVQIAGPALSATALRLASLPLDPEFAARLERAHRNYFDDLRKSQRRAARRALIKRKHPPVNVLGGYRFPGAPTIDLSPLPEPKWAVPSRWRPSPAATDCPDIPEFLRRRPHAQPSPPARPAVCRPAPSRRPQSHSWTARSAQDRTEAWVSLRVGRGNP
jgi:hypothetical protein